MHFVAYPLYSSKRKILIPLPPSGVGALARKKQILLIRLAIGFFVILFIAIQLNIISYGRIIIHIPPSSFDKFISVVITYRKSYFECPYRLFISYLTPNANETHHRISSTDYDNIILNDQRYFAGDTFGNSFRASQISQAKK